MKDFIIITVCIALCLLFIKRAKALRDKPESKLSIFEHPSTFTKPPIEMVATAHKKEEDSQLLTLQESEDEENGFSERLG